jgi:hypothetical protein
MFLASIAERLASEGITLKLPSSKRILATAERVISPFSKRISAILLLILAFALFLATYCP